jgi:hypothetical protein
VPIPGEEIRDISIAKFVVISLGAGYLKDVSEGIQGELNRFRRKWGTKIGGSCGRFSSSD